MFRAVDGWHVALDFNAELAGADDHVFAPSVNVVDEDETHRGRRARNGLFRAYIFVTFDTRIYLVARANWLSNYFSFDFHFSFNDSINPFKVTICTFKPVT